MWGTNCTELELQPPSNNTIVTSHYSDSEPQQPHWQLTLLPVNAMGDVRLRSVGSRSNVGTPATPKFKYVDLPLAIARLLPNASNASNTVSPRYTLMMAGGASWPPKR